MRVAESGDKAGLSLPAPATPGIDWRLHPAAPELAGLYKSKTLAFVHAAGIPEPNRSHFVANDIMDRGAASSAGWRISGSGWLGRYLARAEVSGSGLPAVSASGALAGEFPGFAPALSVPDLANGLPLPWDEKAASASKGCTAARRCGRSAGASRVRGGQTDRRQAAAQRRRQIHALSGAEGSLRQSRRRWPGPQDGCTAYQGSVALTVASADAGGWDTHEGQQGHFQNNVQRLSAALGAFWNDIAAYQGRVTVVAFSEIEPPATLQQERRHRPRTRRRHDRDGRGCSGGRILGPWPGLEEAALDERVDLAVKTDYRQVLTELLTFHGGEPLGPNVFPGYKAPAQLGIVA